MKWLQAANAGVDWTDYPEIRSHPVILTNVHIHAVPMSEHLFGMLLMLVRQLHIAYFKQQERTWEGDTLCRFPETLVGKTLCIVGLGVIRNLVDHLVFMKEEIEFQWTSYPLDRSIHLY